MVLGSTRADRHICPVSQVVAHQDALAPSNALDLVRRYDVVVDASDNAPTRYLLSDACVVAGRPLVSGAALGTDGQVTVYNQEPDGAHPVPLQCHADPLSTSSASSPLGTRISCVRTGCI